MLRCEIIIYRRLAYSPRAPHSDHSTSINTHSRPHQSPAAQTSSRRPSHSRAHLTQPVVGEGFSRQTLPVSHSHQNIVARRTSEEPLFSPFDPHSNDTPDKTHKPLPLNSLCPPQYTGGTPPDPPPTNTRHNTSTHGNTTPPYTIRDPRTMDIDQSLPLMSICFPTRVRPRPEYRQWHT